MLIGNGMLIHKVPITLLGLNWTQFQKDESFLLQSNSDAFSNLSAYPTGYNPQRSIVPPRTAGRMTSLNTTEFSVTPTGTMLQGFPIAGSASITINTNTPAGELIVSGSGSASLTISTNTPLLTASLNGSGTADITISTNTPTLGAEASLTASSSITFTATLTPYAVGFMAGTTEDTGLSVPGIVNGVWSAIAANYNDAGTMGEKLNGAGSAGNPWTEVIEAGYTAEQILRIVAASLAGKVSGADTSSVTFTGLDGTTARITGTVDGSGNRTSVTLNGS